MTPKHDLKEFERTTCAEIHTQDHIGTRSQIELWFLQKWIYLQDILASLSWK